MESSYDSKKVRRRDLQKMGRIRSIPGRSESEQKTVHDFNAPAKRYRNLAFGACDYAGDSGRAHSSSPYEGIRGTLGARNGPCGHCHPKQGRKSDRRRGPESTTIGARRIFGTCKEFVAESQDTIRNQVRKMGSSCDWSRERYTFDDDLSKAVNEVFVRMYNDGLIYRGHRIVNWCTRCNSTLSDDEVEYVERQDPFYYIKYGPVTIGTARPETKFADKVIIVHPDDERYKELIGKEFDVPWINSEGSIKAKVVADADAANMEMGSGAMTITPAHSFVDFELAKKHGFEIKPIIDTNGKMLPIAGEFAGMDVKDCRKKLAEKMQQMGIMERIDENYVHNLSVCYRCNTPIEPLVSEQWFVDVNKRFKINDSKLKTGKSEASLKELTEHAVQSGSIEIIPDRFKKGYFNWTENLRDWCISRQIWWGHRIPVWYKNEEIYVGTEAPEGDGWIQDEDTLDTWFSSGLWTFSTLGWPEKTQELDYFHPTSVLETGYDILTFWVLRMVMMSTYSLNDIPFEKVYLHGLIRDKEGRKMSKSLGNGIDPIDMIEQFGADALRMSMLIGNTPGNDMRLYEEKIKGYRNFTNKLWNASRFVIGILENNPNEGVMEAKSDADHWILGKLNDVIQKTDDALENFRISEAGELLYDFMWNDFCDWYLELSKGDKQNPGVLKHVLTNIIVLLHPFTPFVTEQIWSEMNSAEGANDHSHLLIREPYPTPTNDHHNTESTQIIIDVIRKIRHLRSENKIEPAKKVDVALQSEKHTDLLERNAEDIRRLARVENLTIETKKISMENAASDWVSDVEIFVPLDGLVDPEKEKARVEKEVQNLQQYIAGLKAKLGNAQFVANAPETVVAGEKAKLADAEAKLEKLKSHTD
ncbi:valine--tRNA ligase [Candidatus Peregrinibacteria bacterium]|nr:MAG: valine--tRNA ligase [Candidatus Peregrinibacteria bacterium]